MKDNAGHVAADPSTDPAHNLCDILQKVARHYGVSNMQKLNHLNNFVKLICSVGLLEEKLGFTLEEIIICLRLALLSESTQVRAAGLRTLRYLIGDSCVLKKVLALQVDYFIAKCIDIHQSNEAERTQALRLARKMMSVNALLFPSSITNSLIAVGSGGPQEGDDMVRPSVAILCELSVKNPSVVAQSSGLSTILRSVTDCRLRCMSEALVSTVLHLLNHPHTRQFVRADVELEQILTPYTDCHYSLPPGRADEQLKEDREAGFLASKMSIIASFRSWSGIINLCKPGNSGVQSLIDLLCIPNTEVRRGLLEVIYEVFLLAIPVGTTDFSEALTSVDPSRLQEDWRLTDGFVVSEALVILPQQSRSKPNLTDNYLAFLLSTFINRGLLEGLVGMITSSDDYISIRATILLGELLHMANTILPHGQSHHLHCLPALMNMAACCDVPQEQRLQARVAVNRLKRFHDQKKQGPTPSSLYLAHILLKAVTPPPHCSQDAHLRPQRDIFAIKDTDDALMVNMRESHVLNHLNQEENLQWNWELVETILKWPNVNLQSNKDELMHKFVRRLLFFYMPSSQQFGLLPVDHLNARQLTGVGCLFIEFLLESGGEEGDSHLEDLVKDIVQWIQSSAGLKEDSCHHGNGPLTTLSQHYFLFLGTLSAHPHGVKVLEKGSVYQCLLNLCMQNNQEPLVKLTVSVLDYSRDSLARLVLSKVLIAATDRCRLYATKQLRVLLRANAEFYSSWGVELLVTQLYDRSKDVRNEALEILHEACEDKANLHALIELKPALTHLGDKGGLLLLRYLSIPNGFSYLNQSGYITEELEKWQQKYNLKYVDMVEEQLNEALTTYQRSLDGNNFVNSSNQRLQRPTVYPPVHLYGQLVNLKAGCQLLDAQKVVPDLGYIVRHPILDKWESVKRLKAALWALGNVGSTNWGLNLLSKERIVPDIVSLAQHCEVLSIRGTCLYVLGFIGKTKRGCEVLKQHGWDAVCHSRRARWPVVPGEMDLQTDALASAHTTQRTSSEVTCSRDRRRESHSVDHKRLHNTRDQRGSGRDHEGRMEKGDGRRDSVTEASCDPPCVLSEEEHLADSPSGNTESSLGEEDHGAEEREVEGKCVLPWAVEVEAEVSEGRQEQSPPSETRSACVRGLGAAITAPDIQDTHALISPDPRYALPIPEWSSSARPLRSASLTPVPSFTARGRVHSNSRGALGAAPLTYTSPRDAVGYAVTRRLQQQRIHPFLSQCELLASPAHDVLFTDAITMTTGSLSSQRFLETLRFGSLHKEDLLSPITQNTLQRTMVPTVANGNPDDYIGIALPVHVNHMLHIKETPYFQKTDKFYSGANDGPGEGFHQAGLDSQPGIKEQMEVNKTEQQQTPGSEETGLQEHNEDNCLYCSGLSVLSLNSQSSHQDLVERPLYSEWWSTSSQNHLETATLAKRSGRSGSILSQCSVGSGNSAEMVLGVRTIPENALSSGVLLRKEVLRLVINLSSSVGTKGNQSSLLTIKEKFPHAFDDVCLYSEISYLLAHHMFRLPSRRFIQELFQDVPFLLLYEEAESVLSTKEKAHTRNLQPDTEP